MSGKLILSPVFIAVAVLLLSTGSLANDATGEKRNINRVKVSSGPRTRLVSTERAVSGENPSPEYSRSRSQSPGLIIGQTTYDQQSIGRMNRQVDWRGNQTVHFVWTKQTNFMRYGDCGTAYEVWDAEYGELVYAGTSGGCDIHQRSGYGIDYSAYASLDVDTESRAVISNHHDEGSGFSSTIWWDYSSATCFFSPGQYRIPDSTYAYPDLAYPGAPEYVWPSHEFQVWDSDTVIHLFARQGNEAGLSGIAYFRFIGGYSLGSWQYPPVMVDTVDVFGHVVTASRVSPKVALVWIAKLPEISGDGESECTGRYMENDVYYCISQDMGATWGEGGWPSDDKFNITKSDITKPG
ncbi:MAG: hypothetical protein JSU69_08810, partial [Candidatus Zixiibacteriota bacterium]